ncbi:hypothetical protein CR513_37681, partial [Mucuna pruriens]
MIGDGLGPQANKVTKPSIKTVWVGLLGQAYFPSPVWDLHLLIRRLNSKTIHEAKENVRRPKGLKPNLRLLRKMINCCCDVEASLWTSWLKENLDHHFYNNGSYQGKEYNFFEWVNTQLNGREKKNLTILLKKVENMKMMENFYKTTIIVSWGIVIDY